MTIETLLQLSRNPHYVMTEEEQRQLEEHREKEYAEKLEKNRVIKNISDFSKHKTTIEE